jgi:hypothetical protein
MSFSVVWDLPRKRILATGYPRLVEIGLDDPLVTELSTRLEQISTSGSDLVLQGTHNNVFGLYSIGKEAEDLVLLKEQIAQPNLRFRANRTGNKLLVKRWWVKAKEFCLISYPCFEDVDAVYYHKNLTTGIEFSMSQPFSLIGFSIDGKQVVVRNDSIRLHPEPECCPITYDSAEMATYWATPVLYHILDAETMAVVDSFEVGRSVIGDLHYGNEPKFLCPNYGQLSVDFIIHFPKDSTRDVSVNAEFTDQPEKLLWSASGEKIYFSGKSKSVNAGYGIYYYDLTTGLQGKIIEIPRLLHPESGNLLPITDFTLAPDESYVFFSILHPQDTYLKKLK